MVKVTGPVFSVDAKGTLGDVVTYQGGFGGHRVTVKPGHRDAESETQLEQRALFQQAIAYWKALSPAAKAEYNAIADSMRMTGYQYVLKEYMLGRLEPGGVEGLAEWVAGVPVLTDNVHLEWVSGRPFVRYNAVV